MTECRIVSFAAESVAISRIRQQVFTHEQGVDSAIDFDGLDDQATHALVFHNGTPVGTGRLLDDGHIGRVAVLPQYRSKGLGAAIMQALIDTGVQQRQYHFFLYAQVDAVPFYKKLGFSSCGENFKEAGILHTPMEFSPKSR